MASSCQVIPMPRRPVRVLCIYNYWRRESGIVRTYRDAVMISVRESEMIESEFRKRMHERGGADIARGYQFVGYITENGRRSF